MTENLRRLSIAGALVLQLALPSALTLVYIPLVLREAKAAPAVVENTMSLTLLVLAIGIILQSLGRGPIGSGLLLPSLCSGLYFAPAVLAASAGGQALLSGMMLLAGAFEFTFSLMLRWLKPVLTDSITGLALVFVGFEIAVAGLRATAAEANSLPSAALSVWAVSTVATLGLAAAWLRGAPLIKIFAPLVIFGAAIFADRLLFGVKAGPAVSLFALPFTPAWAFSFQANLVLPFFIAAFAATIRTVGGVQVLHETVKAPGAPRVAEAIRADALGSMLCGLVGSLGSIVGLNAIASEKAAGTANPRLAWAVALLFGLLALCPALLSFIASAPGCAAGPILIFYGVTMALPGWHLLAKKSSPYSAWQAGVPLGVAALAAIQQNFLPALASHLPKLLATVIHSTMTIGIFSAILIRLVIMLFARTRTHPQK